MGHLYIIGIHYTDKRANHFVAKMIRSLTGGSGFVATDAYSRSKEKNERQYRGVKLSIYILVGQLHIVYDITLEMSWRDSEGARQSHEVFSPCLLAVF